MKRTSKIIAAAAAAVSLAFAGAVLAHPGGGMGWGMGPGMGPGMGQGMGQGMGPGMGGGMGWGMGPGMRGRMGGSDMGAIAAVRTAELKQELKITPAQESAWKAYESVVQQQASAMEAARARMHELMQKQQPGAGTADFAAQRETMIKLRETHQAARSAALKDLYAVLAPEQRVILDRHPIGMGGPRAGRTPPAR